MSDRFSIRWMVRKDMDQVVQIERLCFGQHAWTTEDFFDALRNRRVISHVATLAGESDRVIGYAIKLLRPKRIELWNIAVHPEWQRSGIGTLLLHHVARGVGDHGRTELTAQVRDGNLPGQLFLKHNGLVCESIVHRPYEACDDDGYVFRLRVGDRKPDENTCESGPVSRG
jgi:ribosomal-protein-alanine N-acetyltransferase